LRTYNLTADEELAREERIDDLFGDDKPTMEAYYYIMDYISMKKILRDEDLGLAFEMVFSFIKKNELS